MINHRQRPGSRPWRNHRDVVMVRPWRAVLRFVAFAARLWASDSLARPSFSQNL